MAQIVKNLPTMQETWVQSLSQADPLEEEMATHSSILAWKIPWTEEPGGLQSMGVTESDMTEVTNTDRWWAMLITGEIMHVYGGEYMGNLCTFQFSCEPETSLKNKILTWKEGRREGRKARKWVGFFTPSPLPAVTRWKRTGLVAESPCGTA